ncbi:hypothetical protein EUZ93_00610 [Wolbachia pipientis]|nr:hypothetical protein [Wolbachia pipientis]
MAIKKEKFFEIINEVSKNEGLNENNLLERIGSKLKGVNPEAYSTYNNLKIDKLFVIQDLDKIASYTLLHLAVECNSVPIVKLLLEKKVNVDEQMLGDINSKFTALHIAALHGHQEIVQLLLDANANPLLKNSKSQTPREAIGDMQNRDTIIEILKEEEQRYNGISDCRGNNNTKIFEEKLRFFQRIENSTPTQLKETKQQLANNQKRIEHDDLHNQHPEHYTTYNEEQTSSDLATDESSNDSGTCFDADEALGQSISENGEDINAQDEDGLITLHHAAANGDVKTAKYLIDNGANVNAQDRAGHTPLHYAASENYKELAKLLIEHGADVNAQDRAGHTPLYYAVKNDNKESAKLLIKHGADRSLIKDEDLIDGLNSMCGQLSEVVSGTSSHSKTHNATEAQGEVEKVKKLRVKLKKSCAQLEDKQKENQSLKQKIQELGNENATLKGELEKTKKNAVPLEKAQKELTELRSYFTGHGARLDTLEKLNEENESLKQKIKSLENENTPLKGELGKTKTKTNEMSLEKVGKRQFSSKVAYASLAAMLVVGAALSIASGLSALLIVAASVVSALIAGGVTYTMSTKPTTELKEVDIQGSVQHGICKT